jgi:DNA-binding XRE family transcriptional regulator
MSSTSSVPKKSDLAAAIQEHRLRHRLSQNQLAMRLGVTQQSVARWEKGAPPRRDMIQIIQAELAGGSEQDVAQVIAMPWISGSSPSNDELLVLRSKFIEGCIRILERGEHLPDSVIVAIAREVGLTARGDAAGAD